MDALAAVRTAQDPRSVALAALDTLPDPCVVLQPVTDVDGRIVDFMWIEANRAACEYNGVEHDELMGQRLLERLPNHRSSGIFEAYARVIETGVDEVRADYAFAVEDANGPFRWFDLRAVRADGNLVLTWRDSTERHEQALRTVASDRRYHLLADHSSDVVYETDADAVIVWVSPSIMAVLGWQPEDWLGKRIRHIAAAEDFERMLGHRDMVIGHGQILDAEECRVVTATGDHLWVSLRVEPFLDADGRFSGVVVRLRVVQDEVVARRAATMLSAGNAILVRAETEVRMLFEMCEMAVEKSGYRFAWYGRAMADERRSVHPMAWSSAQRDYVDDIETSWGDGPLGQGPTGTCIRLGEPRIVSDFLADPSYEPWVDAAMSRGFRSSVSLPVFVGGLIDGAFMVYAAEVNAFDERATTVMLDLAAQMGYGIGRLRDSRRLASALDEKLLLTTAIDQAAEAVVLTDTTPIIRYANPAALRITGYTAEEVIGKNPSVFQSGLHDEVFYEQMWARLLGGHSWHGVLMNRRRSGELYEEDATITPVHDADGALIAYVAVKHDLTRERGLEATVSRDQLDRDTVIDVMRDVRPAESLAATAAALCRAVARFSDIDGAMVIMLQADGSAVPVAVEGPLAVGQQIGAPLVLDQLDRLIQLCDAGAWWMDFRNPAGLATVDPAFAEGMLRIGYVAAAYTPIRWDGELLGAISVGTFSDTAADWMPSRLGLLAEVGSFAGMLLGPQAVQYGRTEQIRREVAEIIRDQRFHSVFEPVIDLITGEAVGYEALTRFDDDVTPERRFDDAHVVGVGGELEAACATAALVAAESLPAGVWVAVNFSPSTLVEGRAAAVVAGTSRPVVIEITEHTAIENYAAVRRAIQRCGDVRVAVDDAGSGFASLRHILELRPDIIKLDLALVRGIDTDPAKQALAAGLRHFAALTGTTLIAEGVETEAQADIVRQLGIHLAQGYLYQRTV